MGMRLHRARTKQAFKVRWDLYQRHGTWNWGTLEEDAGKRATTLVVECGQTLLELIIAAAADHPDASADQRGDEKILRKALGDRGAVERTWAFLAHALAERTAEEQGSAGADD